MHNCFGVLSVTMRKRCCINSVHSKCYHGLLSPMLHDDCLLLNDKSVLTVYNCMLVYYKCWCIVLFVTNILQLNGAFVLVNITWWLILVDSYLSSFHITEFSSISGTHDGTFLLLKQIFQSKNLHIQNVLFLPFCDKCKKCLIYHFNIAKCSVKFYSIVYSVGSLSVFDRFVRTDVSIAWLLS